MSALSNYLESALLQEIFNGVNYAAPSTWVALYTTATDDAGGGTEVIGGSYVRVRVYANSGGTPDWNVAAVDGVGYVVDNNDDITFPTASGSWGVVEWFAIVDTASGACNFLYHGQLDAPKTVGSGDTFKFSAGNLNLRLE